VSVNKARAKLVKIQLNWGRCRWIAWDKIGCSCTKWFCCYLCVILLLSCVYAAAF